MKKKMRVFLWEEMPCSKREGCAELRASARTVLAEIGQIDPYMREKKNSQLEAEFAEWIDRFLERLETKFELWSTRITSLEGAFTKFWDEQGKIDKVFAKLNKERMGMVEHLFMLRGISRRIEDVIDILDGSDDANEVRHYSGELKKYTRILVEWNNEYQRLHKEGGKVSLNSSIQSAYQNINEGAGQLDRMAISEIYPNNEGKKGYEGKFELDIELDTVKKGICDKMLSDLGSHFGDALRQTPYKQHRVVIRGGSVRDEGAEAFQQAILARNLLDIAERINVTSVISDLSHQISLLKQLSHRIGFESDAIVELENIIAQAISGRN